MNELINFTTCRIAELHPGTHQHARIAGIITTVRTRQTKRGDRFGIITFDDGTSQIEAVCFTEPYQKFRSLLNVDQLLIVDGEVSIDEFNNNPRITVRDLYTLDHARQKFGKYVQIQFKQANAIEATNLRQILSRHTGGNCPVVLRCLDNEVQTDIRLGTKWMVKPSEQLFSSLQEQLNIDCVEVVY